MGNWHRRPKRIDLKSIIKNRGVKFVFDAKRITQEELHQVRMEVGSVVATERLILNSDDLLKTENILVMVVESDETLDFTELEEGCGV